MGNGKDCCEPSSISQPCSDFQLTKVKDKDDCFINNTINESLNIGGADVNVYKLLGIHEQGSLIDLAKNGNTLSGGSGNGYPSDNAFNIYDCEWRSLQTGQDVITSAYIGYDFGLIKIDDQSRRKYSNKAAIRHHIATIKIKQGINAQNRITKARIERSFDNQTWYGVSVITLPDNDELNTIHFRHSTNAQFWRIRPLAFNGGAMDFWSVVALELIDYIETNLDNVEDKIFLENRNRDYSTDSILIKGTYDLLDTQTELSKFGFDMIAQQYYITVHFDSMVSLLGRPLVIGDIIELPSETQFTPTLEPIKKYLEITDVTWSTEGFTPGFTPTLSKIVAQPVMASQETQDIFGDLAGNIDTSGLIDIDDGLHEKYQDYSDVSQEIQQQAIKDSPEKGADGSTEIRFFEEEDIALAEDNNIDHLHLFGLNPNGLYVEDAMPQNNDPFTEGDEFPANPADKDYHRLTYINIDSSLAPRLYRFSAAKDRWIYLETDRRIQFNSGKPTLQEYLTDPDAVPTSKVTKED